MKQAGTPSSPAGKAILFTAVVIGSVVFGGLPLGQASTSQGVWGRTNPSSLQRCTPEEQGMDSELLAGAIDYLLGQRDLFYIHSLTVLRKGHLVADVYFHPYQAGELHKLESLSKVFLSAAIGLAIDKGYIASVDEKVIDFFPGLTIAHLDDRKRAITIEHLLTYTSGLGGELDYDAEAAELSASEDKVQYALDLQMSSEPGTVFRYSNVDVLLVSAIITQATGTNTYEFLRAHMFRPLGIVDSLWGSLPQGHTDLGCEITPHDLAVFGELYLRQGSWDGQQLLSESWIATSTTPQIAGQSYIWGWYSDFYWGAGGRGQRMVVAPAYDLVVVFTGGGYAHEDIERIYQEALDSYIFAAVQSADALQPDPAGASLLSDAIDRAGSVGREPQPVEPLPPMADQVSGQTYVMDVPVGYLSLTLTFPTDDEARLAVVATRDLADGAPLEFAAGLDGIERFARGSDGFLAAGTGEWLNDHTFVMEVDTLGKLQLMVLTFEFEGDAVTVTQEDPFWFDPAPTRVFTGRVEGRRNCLSGLD